MPTPEQILAREAVARLEPMMLVTMQIATLQFAVRALIATSPDPAATREKFDQLLGQLLASPANLGRPDNGVVLRDLAETLFRSPVSLGD